MTSEFNVFVHDLMSESYDVTVSEGPMRFDHTFQLVRPKHARPKKNIVFIEEKVRKTFVTLCLLIHSPIQRYKSIPEAKWYNGIEVQQGKEMLIMQWAAYAPFLPQLLK